MNLNKKATDLAKSLGYTIQKTESWNHFAKVKNDFAGIADFLAWKPGKVGVLAIQVTSRSNHSSRVKKLLNSQNTPSWLASFNRIQVWSWDTKGMGKRRITSFVLTGSEKIELKELDLPDEEE